MRAHIIAALAAWLGLGAHAEVTPAAFQPESTAAKIQQELRLYPSAAAQAQVTLPALPDASRAKIESGLERNQVGVSRREHLSDLPPVTEAALRWQQVAEGSAAQLRVVAPGAGGLRVGLLLEAVPKDLELRVAESGEGGLLVIAETSATHLAKLHRGAMPIEYWSPTTEGPTQLMEFFTQHPQALRFRLLDVSHLLRSGPVMLQPKADFSCHVDVSCVSEPSVRTSGRATARMVYVKNGGSFVCTGALLNDRASSFTPNFATANHCISTASVAATLETRWFYYPSFCGGNPQAGTRLTGGATLLLTDFDTDFTLLRLSQAAPGGSSFLGWDPAPLTVGQSVYGVHHPNGEFQRYMGASFMERGRITNTSTGVTFGQPFNRVRVSQGIVEGGSSGSPLLTLPVYFRGTLFGSPNTNACGSPNNVASYSDFSVFYPLIRGYLEGPATADDYGNSPASATAVSANADFAGEINRAGDQDWFRYSIDAAGDFAVRSRDAAPGVMTDVVGTLYAANGTSVIATSDDRAPNDFNFEIAVRLQPGTYYLKVAGYDAAVGRYRISSRLAPSDDHGDTAATATSLASTGAGGGFLGSPTDRDWFRVTFAGAGTFTVASTGSTDVIGAIYQSDGGTLVAENDDAQPPDTNFSLTVSVNGATTGYLRVSGYDGAMGSYGLTTTFVPSSASSGPNYTDLWWNPAQSGWGMNLNHQGSIIFATVFTYDGFGRDRWVVGSALTRQADGRYQGPYYNTRGHPFNSSGWSQPVVSQEGQMTLTFDDANSVSVSFVGGPHGMFAIHSMERQRFSVPPSCSFTSASRTGAANYQDLWWNPSESGWGLNITHQGQIIFATLFLYATDNQPMWLAASGLARQFDGSYSGPLYRTSGGRSYQETAGTWPGVQVTEVGTMRLQFSNGNSGVLTYTMNGITVVKQIQRQVFGSETSVCR